jgi:hypothetical protein
MRQMDFIIIALIFAALSSYATRQRDLPRMDGGRIIKFRWALIQKVAAVLSVAALFMQVLQWLGLFRLLATVRQ